MFDFMLITKSLSDQNRIRILYILQGRALCVQQVVSLLNLSPSTVSKHISILEQARLVESVRNGKWVFYTVASKDVNPLVENVLHLVNKGMGNSKQAKVDLVSIKEIEKKYCKVHGVSHCDVSNNIIMKG